MHIYLQLRKISAMRVLLAVSPNFPDIPRTY